ncbi:MULTISPECIES: TetR/AcrR family transcriptional regulator [Streptomyces]|uniref:TetR/AcrR family transcriptional regulator n=1 Tax=Streptomyces TaxID=1883 RepID=UPI00081B756E|nr:MULTISPECIES: TetR/AcrR family transcriptional regulator [unclassified Streptomyces]MYQ51215.1 TetR family transcriptional regulator [Streptomyces sp. SID4941]SCD56261.1 transcriptional regulator, TetR family [Streptomyces sp. PalvLS-984]SDB93833.1 transcriptional regulator, TetR family [Streptomyces sp. AmelKG-A3]
MPKIEADSVREHRAQRLAQLIDAAEAILEESGVDSLTAGAVAARAGIARNSIYRYFDSIEDLLELVVTREFPAWIEAVEQAISAETTPEERAAAYVRANLEQAARGTHGWRASLSRGRLSPSARERVRELHTSLHEALAHVIRDLGCPQPELTVAVLQAVVDACIRRIDQGDELTVVSDFATQAVHRLLEDGQP